MGCFFSALNDDTNDDPNFQAYNSGDTYNMGDTGTQNFADQQFPQQQYGAGVPQQQYDSNPVQQQMQLQMANASWQPSQAAASMPI